MHDFNKTVIILLKNDVIISNKVDQKQI